MHATLDLAGNLRFGPDVEWLPDGTQESALDYSPDDARLPRFEAAIRRYWPGLPRDRLSPDYTGCRPKLVGPGEPAADFVIRSEPLTGLINLYGIESPGLSASLAIADWVEAHL